MSLINRVSGVNGIGSDTAISRIFLSSDVVGSLSDANQFTSNHRDAVVAVSIAQVNPSAPNDVVALPFTAAFSVQALRSINGGDDYLPVEVFNACGEWFRPYWAMENVLWKFRLLTAPGSGTAILVQARGLRIIEGQ
jgi:hypothetical protein